MLILAYLSTKAQENNNSFGRHASNDPNIEGKVTCEEDIDFSVTKFTFCEKF